jgi:hypothetical protein
MFKVGQNNFFLKSYMTSLYFLNSFQDITGIHLLWQEWLYVSILNQNAKIYSP